MVIKERYEHYMKRHELEQQPENLVYYTYPLFEPFSSQLICTTSTRLGGVSEGPLHSLNLSTRVGDDEHRVNTNRLRLSRVMNIEPGRVAQAQLVHGHHIEVITEQSPKGFSYKFPTTDGLVTNVAHVPLFIPVADCAAVAFFDPQQRVIGMVHSGWKEVREDFIRTLTEAFSTKAQDFLLPQVDDTIHFDMWAALRWQLEVCGIKHVEGPTICTACQVDEFYSHRAEHGRTGRFAGVIVLRA